jgi:hypothetical protein
MTTTQLIATILVYSAALLAAIYFTGAARRRIAGALAGGAAAGWIMVGAVALGNGQGWWRVPLPTAPAGLALFYLACAISCAPIYLITWRVARRFGGRGLAVCVALAAAIGPPRDYLIAGMFPEWMVFAPGVAPILADAAVYAGFVGLGHGVMRLVAGPARKDQTR